MTDPTPNTAADKLPRVGHYQLLDSIGRGGMGLVYRARDTRLEREVAIKCLRTELFEAHYIERFKREALLLAKLNHPNIVQIYDFIEAPEQIALVMELVDGQNLHVYLREHIVPVAQRLQWLVHISEGLAVAHDAGIIHRDLKAENILINKRGQAKITDLGIAKSQDFNATLTDHIAGSYCSMSPEQALGEAITFKSDLFSLGILAYQLLCGAHPFGDTGNKLQVMQRIISHPPASPQQHNPDLPAEFIDLLGQLLSKDPDKRPDSAHWVAAQFARLKELHWRDEAPGDATQALATPASSNTRTRRTQDHPTFDTRYIAHTASGISPWQTIKDYVTANKIALGSAALSLLIIAAITVWQMQPKPPRYVAVIPPKLMAEGMPDSQQELIKEAVYDAIQQSIIQLNDYYLIPRSELKDADTGIDVIGNATAADEIITAEIKCKSEVCKIALTRLAKDNQTNARLRVKDTKIVDVSTDNYLSIAEIILSGINSFYHMGETASLPYGNEGSYKQFLSISKDYQTNGANRELLDKLDQLDAAIKESPALHTLYREITLDIYNQTPLPELLDRLERILKPGSKNKTSLEDLYNLYFLRIAQERDAESQELQKLITENDARESTANELQAYKLMIQKDYVSASGLYKKVLNVKPTAKNFFLTANAFWYHGNIEEAKKYLQKSIELSPRSYEAHSLNGIIALTEGRIADAIASFELTVAKNSNDIHNLSNLGLCYLLAKHYDLATQTFAKAALLFPYHDTIILNLADAQNLSGQREIAVSNYQKVIERNQTPQHSEQFQILAQAYAHIGDLPNALAALRKLEQIDGANLETYYAAAIVNTLSANKSAAVFNIHNSLKNGLDLMWFDFPWFDNLCTEKSFKQIMDAFGGHNRCPPQTPITDDEAGYSGPGIHK